MLTKECTVCGEVKPKHDFYHTQGYCKICSNLKSKQRRIRKMNPHQQGHYIIECYRRGDEISYIAKVFECSAEKIIEYLKLANHYDLSKKPCYRCGQVKNIEEFKPNERNISGWCYECKLKYDKKYYRKNAKRIKEQIKDYYYENRDFIREKQKGYREENSEKLKLQRRKYYEKNRDEILKKHKKYYEENSDRLIEYQLEYREKNRAKSNKWKADYRAAILQRTPAWADHEKILKFYEEAYRLTIETGILHAVDHIIPLRGKNVSGLHVHNNLQVITFHDNCVKSNKFKN